MAYDNGIIPKEGNVAIADIQRALRSSKCDIGSLATDAERINKWAKYKPQAIGGVEDISERDRSGDAWGLVVPIYADTPDGARIDPVRLLHKWLNGEGYDGQGRPWWSYRAPKNDDTKRFTDFRGYNGRCEPINSDPNPEGNRTEAVNVVEREGEYEGHEKVVTFACDYPTKAYNVDWAAILNPSDNRDGGVGWHFMTVLVPGALPSAIESPFGGDNQLASMWSAAIELVDSEAVSSAHKAGVINWQVPYPDNTQQLYTAIFCWAEGTWADGVFVKTGRYCPLYGNFYKVVDVSRHIDNLAEVLQIGWIPPYGSEVEWHDMLTLGETNPRTADIFFRMRIWRTNNKVGFGDVVAQAFNGELCNGVTEVQGRLAVQSDSQPTLQVSAPGQASSITIPAIGSSDSYYPSGRAWVETADYAEFVWQFPNLWPNINKLALSGTTQPVNVAFSGKWGDALTIFASKIINVECHGNS